MAPTPIQDYPGFYEKLAECIRAKMTSGSMHRVFRDTFPEAYLSASLDTLNHLLKHPVTWQKLAQVLGEQKARELYAMRLRQTVARARDTTQILTFEELLGTAGLAA
jgi:hypothetical protein